MQLEETTWLCDACTRTAPTWRYTLPAGFVVLPELAGKVGPTYVSSGSYGMCDECHGIAQGPGTHHAKAHKLRDLMFLSPKLAHLGEQHRKVARQLMFSAFVRLLGVLSDPRPCVKGDDPMDAKIVRPPKADPRNN